MYATQLETLRNEKLYFELYEGNKYLRGFQGTAETLNSYLTAFRIESYSKHGNVVCIHFYE